MVSRCSKAVTSSEGSSATSPDVARAYGGLIGEEGWCERRGIEDLCPAAMWSGATSGRGRAVVASVEESSRGRGSYWRRSAQACCYGGVRTMVVWWRTSESDGAGAGTVVHR
ncbi:hypothetical protein EUGRSUZ_C03437 [Eucalyptus grandis]|uniref:Uncharacterized protein n=2 Tax=Eucalyptus grandis TaxID=71139 RepID=A0ACC3LKG4_EUCGR|nr:hypothetical protein EUGRSUZ_C03437 [Eucalyptus grandis]